MNGECISGTQLGVGLEDGSFHVLNMTLAKDHLMDKEKLLFWSLPAGQLGTIKDIQYNVQEQSPTFNQNSIREGDCVPKLLPSIKSPSLHHNIITYEGGLSF